MRKFVLKIKVDTEWKYFRSYEVEQHAIDNFEMYKYIFDIVLFDGDKVIKRYERAKE
jgi:hypothetical protein